MRILELFTENYALDLEEDQLPPTLKLGDARRLLHKAGFIPTPGKGSHENWKNPVTKSSFSLPAHHTISIGVTKKLYKLLNMQKYT